MTEVKKPIFKHNTAQRLALNIDSHIAVDAGAGTGKTRTIIDRVIEHYLTKDQRATRLLPQPNRPGRIPGGLLLSPESERTNLQNWEGMLPSEVVLLTFTRKAAEEMRNRLRERIAEKRYGSMLGAEDPNHDPRIRDPGFPEQLLMLLEDAPIGTIDSFLNQLVGPYRSLLGTSLGQNVVTEAERLRLIQQGINTLWRLPSGSNANGPAVDAGIPASDVKEILNARDRVARQYVGRRRATRVLTALISKSIFIETGQRGLKEDGLGTISVEKVQSRLLDQLDDSEVDKVTSLFEQEIAEFCDIVRANNLYYPSNGWEPDSRISVLASISDAGRPNETWGRLVWLGQILQCIVSGKLWKSDPTILPGTKLPQKPNWDSGMLSYATLPNGINKQNVKDRLKSIQNDLKQMIASPEGQRILHFTQLSMIISPSHPPNAPREGTQTIDPLPDHLPERMPSATTIRKTGFSIDADARQMDDMRILLRGLKGIIGFLKEKAKVHEFEDVTKIAGDLLLERCPETCRNYYHRRVIEALDSSPDKAWRDDHIHRAFATLESLEADPMKADESSSNLREIRTDLERRFALLKQIRRRYRAFIIDEAQDNSPPQWRILGRLWGPREQSEEEGKIPDTDWQPTICFVGDMKQSIYAFRQAEVVEFRRHTEFLRKVNRQEFNSLKELHIKPELRRENASRDSKLATSQPKIRRASTLTSERAREFTDWIPFNQGEGLSTPKIDEVEARKEGLISLSMNYRTAGGILEVMNHWWADLFSHRHHFFSHSDYYADSQELQSGEEKRENPGVIEWICPVMDDGIGDPSFDLTEVVDPFSVGKVDSIERQAKMIALRILALSKGHPTRVLGADGNWTEIEAGEPVKYGEIMVLMASRGRLRDSIMRNLQLLKIPAQADREGGLMSRPAVTELDGLIQFIARPKSRFAATWVARSSLIGMTDAETQLFIGKAGVEDLLIRMHEQVKSDSQRNLIQRWIDLRASGSLLDLLDETIDQSDLLTAYNDEVSIKEVEQFVEEVRRISREVGEDPIVIADRLRDLRNQSSRALEVQTSPDSDAVRVMSIHGSKGLEAKVVILADLFSGKQVTMTIERINRLIATPELYAGYPKPWSINDVPKSAVWQHVKRLHQSRKDAEARRLLYVAATRVEERLILVGSPSGTRWMDEEGLILPWKYSQSQIQLGQMWAESLRQGSWRRHEKGSHWLDGSEDFDGPVPISESNKDAPRILNPATMMHNARLGGKALNSIHIYHHPDCLPIEPGHSEYTPLVDQTRIDSQARVETDSIESSNQRIENQARIRLAPHRLSNIDSCARRHWLETRGGLRPNSISKNRKMGDSEWDEREEDDILLKIPNPTELGLIVHRILEIGIGNPGSNVQPSLPLPEVWTSPTPCRLLDSDLHNQVYEELMPVGIDKELTNKIVMTMLERIQSGLIGRLTSGEIANEERLEGLRTEYPFTISNQISFEAIPRTRWTPIGLENLTYIEQAHVDMDGSIDLVLCSEGPNGSSIRPIDLKTEQATSILSQNGQLLTTLGEESTEPMSIAEEEMLRHHRLQLALYHRVLEMMEGTRPSGQRRYVERPGILIGVTGRLVIYPEDMFEVARAEIDEIIRTAVRIELSTELPLAEFQRRPAKEAYICDTCPFNRGEIPICGPLDE